MKIRFALVALAALGGALSAARASAMPVAPLGSGASNIENVEALTAWRHKNTSFRANVKCGLEQPMGKQVLLVQRNKEQNASCNSVVSSAIEDSYDA